MGGVPTQQIQSLAQKQGKVLQAQQNQAKAEAETTDKAYTQYGGDVSNALKTYEEQMAGSPLPAFVPTQDTATDLASLGGMVAVLGFMVGRGKGMQPGLAALDSMTGMLRGWQEGRKELYDREREQFKANFDRLKEAHEEYRQQLENALSVARVDIEKGTADAKLAAVKAGDAVTAKQIDVLGTKAIIDAINAQNGVKAKATELILGLYGKQAARGQRYSAINARYSQNVMRAGLEVARQAELIQNLGVDVGVGWVGLVTGKGSISSESMAGLANIMTPDDQRMVASNLRGLAIEGSYILSGGYRVQQHAIDALEASVAPRPGDNYMTAGYKFLDFIAKMRVGIEATEPYDDFQIAQKQHLEELLSKYPSPEQFLEKVGRKVAYNDQVEAIAAAATKKTGKEVTPADVRSQLEKKGYIVTDRIPEPTDMQEFIDWKDPANQPPPVIQMQAPQ